MLARGCSWALVAAVTGSSAVAHAQPSPEDRALATELFQRGRARMTEGRTAEACEMLQASEALDPSGGTMLNLALCHEILGRTATAWSEYREALSMAKRDRRADRVAFVEEHLAALEPKLARLTITLVAVEPGLRVLRDGTPLPAAAWGLDTPIDPGAHEVRVEAPGRTPWRTVAQLAPGQRIEIRVPALTPAPARGTGVVFARPTSTATYVAAFVGVASTSVGVVAGTRAIARRRASDQACVPECTLRAIELNDEARAAADVSTGAFVVAGAAIVAAIVLHLVRPSVPARVEGRQLTVTF